MNFEFSFYLFPLLSSFLLQRHTTLNLLYLEQVFHFGVSVLNVELKIFTGILMLLNTTVDTFHCLWICTGVPCRHLQLKITHDL